MKKPRGEAVLKNLPDALQEELWQLARRTTYPKALAWLKATHGVTVSEPTLSVFFSWYPKSLTLRLAKSTSDQLEDTLKKLPQSKYTAEQAREVASVNFELMAAQNRDAELFTMLGKAKLEAARLELDRAKFEHAKKEDWEKGLDALHEEIKGNAEALKHFEAMKAALKKARAQA